MHYEHGLKTLMEGTQKEQVWNKKKGPCVVSAISDIFLTCQHDCSSHSWPLGFQSYFESDIKGYFSYTIGEQDALS